MIETRTVFEYFQTPDDADVFDHIIAAINGFQATRPKDITQDKFAHVQDALTYGYPVSMWGSLNSSNSAALQSNGYCIMPGYLMMKTLLKATQEDYDFIAANEHQPPWIPAIAASIPSPLLVGHDQHAQIEHSKVNVGNVPIWDGVTDPSDIVQLGIFIHHYGFTHMGVAQAIADAITRGVILLPSVGDGSQAGQKLAIAAYSVILNAWKAKWPNGYPNQWVLYDPVAA